MNVSAAVGDTTAQAGPVPLVLAKWKLGKIHVSMDGIKTACGALIPQQATISRPTVEWHLHTNCYNCAYRLWDKHGPADYFRPSNGSDFPLRKKCPHGRDRRSCVVCTPSAAQNWPCPNGCTDPADHDPLRTYTKCTVWPRLREAGPDGRCLQGCESTERAIRAANPRMIFDLADSAAMYCHHCRKPV
ncbi:hypothetical protein AB0H43_20340 [Hamadaea sp. NPDC050747]|uniref:hypothetical protein n=1 Tax=Hamadaea sp. NPDC050747 TaxID=3155789 RepID=UPI0033D57282